MSQRDDLPSLSPNGGCQTPLWDSTDASKLAGYRLRDFDKLVLDVTARSLARSERAPSLLKPARWSRALRFKRNPAKRRPLMTAHRPWPKVAAAKGAEKQLRDFALKYPDAIEEFPWGERVIKVNKKVFVFISRYQGSLRISTTLPDSGVAALTLPFTEPTGYGLGKSGWVTAHFDDDGKAPVELLCSWIDESYRAVAPRRLVDRLGSKTADGGS